MKNKTNFITGGNGNNIKIPLKPQEFGVYWNGMTYYFETLEQMNKFIEEFVEES